MVLVGIGGGSLVTPEQFIAKWKAVELKERSASQSHFIDLCKLLDEPAPTDADPTGEWYTFERGATKTSGAKGWADVWKRAHFGWEYKGKHDNLIKAFGQLQQYAIALENPPLLVVCDMDRFEIHTNWTNTVAEVHAFSLDDLLDARNREKLKWVMSAPERLKPRLTRDALTEDMASRFADLAKSLGAKGLNPQKVAHFVNRLVFAMFAEDVELLPNEMFKRMLEHCLFNPTDFQSLASDLFHAMRLGGRVGFEKVEWFNGGLFDDDDAMELTREEIKLVLDAARMNWSEVDPSIFGTLFERGLDPSKRSQLGAHYTDNEKIRLIIEPVLIEPLCKDWSVARAEIADQMSKAAAARERRPTRQADARKVYAAARRAEESAIRAAESAHAAFLSRLRNFRILDPACGSGNFLYLALLAIKDLEHRVCVEGEALGLNRIFPEIGPECVKGIEINPYAAELARVTVWIGDIQWQRRNGFEIGRRPILRSLDNIENRDAILNDRDVALWPVADIVIGNPPFLGDRKMIGALGEDYTFRLRAAFEGRVPGGADLVCYWFDKALRQMENGQLLRAGLVATNSIRGGANRKVLDQIRAAGKIFEAYSDEPWVVDGAAVRVSIVCFQRVEYSGALRLDGKVVPEIAADLTAETAVLTGAVKLRENANVSFIGTQKNGPFDIDGALARELLTSPVNPNGRPNSDVVFPWKNGSSVVRRDEDQWIIDFGPKMNEKDAQLYEAPFRYVETHVKPTRIELRRQWHRTKWWLHGDPRPAMRVALQALTRFIITSRVSKHRLFVWCDPVILPDSATVAIGRDDDTTFGILHSRFHEVWSLGLCTWLGVGNDPRYTPSTTFETFPFPAGLTPNIPAATYASDPRAVKIGGAAKRLNELREAWLNPPDLVKRVPEVVPGFPDRVLPVSENAAATLKKRTLTNLYNERPAWLVNAHRELDAAVAAAYGWPAGITDDDALGRLLALNQERSTARSNPDMLSVVESPIDSASSRAPRTSARKARRRSTESAE